jgi:hypothetical protein
MLKGGGGGFWRIRYDQQTYSMARGSRPRHRVPYRLICISSGPQLHPVQLQSTPKQVNGLKEYNYNQHPNKSMD